MSNPTLIQLTGDTDEIAHWMWQNLVPKSGQCDSLQGELLRCIERLRSEARRNGNANWDFGFEIFVDYLEETLCAEPKFDSTTKQEIRADLYVLRDYENPYLNEDLYDRLTEQVVQFARLHPQITHRQKNPDLHR